VVEPGRWAKSKMFGQRGNLIQVATGGGVLADVYYPWASGMAAREIVSAAHVRGLYEECKAQRTDVLAKERARSEAANAAQLVRTRRAEALVAQAGRAGFNSAHRTSGVYPGVSLSADDFERLLVAYYEHILKEES
jgi:hypothetical protein